MAKITIKDVAREAGVSIGTVSNALNDSDVVSDETKVKVLAVAEKLNYIPNLNGKMLKSGKSRIFGFMTSGMGGPYYFVLVDAIYRACAKKEYGLDILVSRDKKLLLGNMLGKRIDGVFIHQGPRRIGKEEISLMEREEIKAVFFDREIEGQTFSSIVFDSYKAGADMTKYLINLGHKRIYFIAGAKDSYDSEQRKQGYIDTLLANGLSFKEEYVLEGLFEEQFTFNSVKTFLRFHMENLPDAIIAGNDSSAIGCIKALKDEGYQVPKDVSVVGFDDIEIAEYFQPPLTTMKNPIARQGVEGVQILFDMISGKPGKTVRLDCELIVRGSCSVRND